MPLPAAALPSRRSVTLWSLAALLGGPAGPSAAQSPPPASAGPRPAPPTVRLRGTVQAATATTLTVKDRGGEVVELALTDRLAVNEVYPIRLEDIQPGSYIGTAAMPQADGSQRAIAVTVFPESSRGVGDGHRPFDLLPQSTMTNGAVANVAGLVGDGAAGGRTLRVTYQGGEKTIVVPADAPVVTSRPGGRELLVPGASVSLFAQVIDGRPTVLRINAGRNGFVLPY